MVDPSGRTPLPPFSHPFPSSSLDGRRLDQESSAAGLEAGGTDRQAGPPVKAIKAKKQNGKRMAVSQRRWDEPRERLDDDRRNLVGSGGEWEWEGGVMSPLLLFALWPGRPGATVHTWKEEGLAWSCGGGPWNRF